VKTTKKDNTLLERRISELEGYINLITNVLDIPDIYKENSKELVKDYIEDENND